MSFAAFMRLVAIVLILPLVFHVFTKSWEDHGAARPYQLDAASTDALDSVDNAALATLDDIEEVPNSFDTTDWLEQANPLSDDVTATEDPPVHAGPPFKPAFLLGVSPPPRT